MKNFKSRAVEIKGKNAEDLIAILNKAFCIDEAEMQPTQGCDIPCANPETCEMKTARTTKALFDAHVAVGFTEEQALEIVKAIIMA